MRRMLLLSLALSLMLGTRAAAQTCVGMPSFSSGQMQLSAGGAFADGTSSFGGAFGYGAPTGLYGKAGIGTTSYDGLDGSSLDLNVAGGYQIPLQTTRKAELCPVASLSIGSGPNDLPGTGVDMSSRTFGVGASAGVLVGHSSQMQILPNASFQFANTRVTLDDGTTSASGSESYGVLTLGTGFVFDSRFSVNPSISFPMGLDGASTSFGLMGAINFGR
ncbi:MAG TPA: hypothetical protein VFU46_00635 [Gemmatimonadales bacterium]|nr:hypothetical protein [Gemmatimonadales bacterium]